MRLFEVVKKPIITEKASTWEYSNSTYVVEVSDDSTKIDIKKAFLDIYWVEISSVRVVKTIEKFKQGRKWLVHKRRASKKAYVTLKDKNAKIDFSILK